ncbi:YggS family pyridoxal phosphate-dependent enzyme [Filimonas effusa]|uniref:Pyridoxal phosphate homeostasis protein n=1 Tax=Filimonas effusa TaxID=2508721 RepID=A0A4Q1D8Z4_9BACT|nr:YggS family pyridoxal phosphate-dependent enzyme [Filimonas effusa]RXK85822.1 YggS family pyridoxal phosphate-dependent enzyme [Filimonas effusa]
MAINEAVYRQLSGELQPKDVTLVAVSKIKPASDIKALYDLGQRDFGENYVQEVMDKQAQLPGDIRWHFIGHLQSNKVKFIAPFVHLIHGVDSEKLLAEINKQGKKLNRVISCLLQVHIAQEETKFGLDASELDALIKAVTTDAHQWSHIRIEGLMGMASFSDDQAKVRAEFQQLHSLYQLYTPATTPQVNFSVLSMGMSGDYQMAIEEGSTMVRIGSLLFGARG